MATYYVDPAAVGLNDGSSWANAWTTLQTAFTTPTAGDTIYMRGTQTLASSLTLTTRSGTISSRLVYVGCNASGVEDGTRFVIDGNNAAASCIDVSGARIYITFRNIECKKATSHGFNFQTGTATKHGWVVSNCKSHLNGGDGFAGMPDFEDSMFERCTSINNTGIGFSMHPLSSIYYSAAINNGSGIGGPSTVISCIVHNNTTFGIEGSTVVAIPILTIKHSTIDGNGSAIITPTTANSSLYIISSRLTNNTTGVVGDADCAIFEINSNFYNNSTNYDATALARIAASVNRTSGSSDPYIDRANDNLNLARNAVGLRQLGTIGGTDSINIIYCTQGVPSDSDKMMAHPGMGGGFKG